MTAVRATSPPAAFDAPAPRAQFRIFTRHPGLIYLDIAASAQKPAAVIEGIGHHVGRA